MVEAPELAVRAFPSLLSMESKVFPCPKKQELGCEETFRRKCLAERHAKQKHGSEDAEDDGMFPCPLKEELNCPKTYTDQTGADKHSMKAHKGHQYPCPSKACDEDFSAPVDARKHGKSHGMSNLYPCPAPEGDKCSIMFPTFDEAQRHLSNRDHNKSVVCQYCSETFYDFKSRGRHEELHTHPFPCPYSWCERRFKTCHEALKHAERQVHNSVGVFYMCNAPDCRTAAMGHVMKPSKLKDHWENHVRLEHVPANSEPSYERGEPRPFKSSPLYEAIYEVNSLASVESFNRGKDNGVHPTMTTDPDVENTEGDGRRFLKLDTRTAFKEHLEVLGNRMRDNGYNIKIHVPDEVIESEVEELERWNSDSDYGSFNLGVYMDWAYFLPLITSAVLGTIKNGEFAVFQADDSTSIYLRNNHKIDDRFLSNPETKMK
ncbi:hypothetical protein DER46DRAFT_571670 [Fusarium sp. MPI-SDFR-AT-0072]|nr:hypothetical protein DER46DRAFT_571670 [Fusarium sp. MPI-SDFR-AT-0072]